MSSKLHPPPLDYLEEHPRPGIISSINILIDSLKDRLFFKKKCHLLDIIPMTSHVPHTSNNSPILVWSAVSLFIRNREIQVTLMKWNCGHAFLLILKTVFLEAARAPIEEILSYCQKWVISISFVLSLLLKYGLLFCGSWLINGKRLQRRSRVSLSLYRPVI